VPAELRELVKFWSELEDPVLKDLVAATAQWERPLGESSDAECAYCEHVMNGFEDASLEKCTHYDALDEAFDRLTTIDKLVPEEKRHFVSDFAYYDSYYSPDWKDIPEGYYAVPDPRTGIDEMTYWRMKTTKRGSSIFGPWPVKARYAPALYVKDLPAGVSAQSQAGRDYIRAWYQHVYATYHATIVGNILTDPVAAGQRFADWAIRCCCCGKALTNDLSKVYGIGPVCRKGLSSEVLANYYRPNVGRAHATVINS
jgi:hypothetical protein